MRYLVIFAVIVAFLGYAPPKYGLQQNNYKNYILICGVLMALISGLRLPYGDTYSYTWYYDQLKNYPTFREYYDEHMSNYDLLSSEAGFYYVMWVLGHFFESGQTAVIFSSVFITIATCFFIRRNSVDVPLSLTIYVCLTLFTFNMNGMRQAMAMSVCLFAYEFSKKRKLIPFVLTVMLAMLFHKTAMCFLPVYILPVLKNSFGNWLFYVFGLIMCLLFVDRIIAVYYEISGEDYSKNSVAEGGGLFVVLLYVGAIGLSLYRHGILKEVSNRTAFMGVLAGLVAYLARYVDSMILERVSYYYYYFMLLLVPASIQDLNEKDYKFVKLLFIAGSLALFAYRVWNGDFRYFKFYFM